MNDKDMVAERPAIRLHIERLVLEGIDMPPAHAPAFRAAVEAELAQLLAKGGVGASLTAAGGHATPELPPATVRLSDTAATAGSQVANAVYRRIGP
jgi:hypothetical protein